MFEFRDLNGGALVQLSCIRWTSAGVSFGDGTVRGALRRPVQELETEVGGSIRAKRPLVTFVIFV